MNKFILASLKAGGQKTWLDQCIEAGFICPECGSHKTEDNGFKEYRCVDCDHRWGIEHGEKYGY